MSGRQDLNLRPRAPKARALPDCATPRGLCFVFNQFQIEPNIRVFLAVINQFTAPFFGPVSLKILAKNPFHKQKSGQTR